MHQLASDPLFQTAVAPFLVALIAGLLLNRLGWYWPGLAAPLGFYAAAWLIIGLELFPLTSTHKTLLSGMVATAAGLVLDASPWGRRRLPWVVAVAAAAAAVWVVWPVLLRREGLSFWALGGGAALYLGWLTAVGAGLRDKPLPAGAAAVSLGLGTGIIAVYGASTLLGQLAASFAAAAGAFLLLAALLPRHKAGGMLMLPALILCGLFGVSGCVYAKVPWDSLPALAIIPVFARLPLDEAKPAWMRAVVLLLVTLAAAAAAVFVTRHVTGPLPSL